MSSGPIVVQVLEGNSAIELNREIMGATNPDQAEAGTIRKEFALSMTENSAHGSISFRDCKRRNKFFLFRFRDSSVLTSFQGIGQ